jgi:hypothetical protein
MNSLKTSFFSRARDAFRVFVRREETPQVAVPSTGRSPERAAAIALASIGIFTRIASAQGVSPSHVIKVARGLRTSGHISEAIRKEVAAIWGDGAADPFNDSKERDV